jgi:hypothetical protein
MTVREFLSALEAAAPFLSTGQRAGIWRDIGAMLAQIDALKRGRASSDERRRAMQVEEEDLVHDSEALGRRAREPA